MTEEEAFALTRREREHQETSRAGLPLASDPSLGWPLKLAALVEEVGEVARCINDGESPDRLQSELVQVAAVAVGWLESRTLCLENQQSLL